MSSITVADTCMLEKFVEGAAARYGADIETNIKPLTPVESVFVDRRTELSAADCEVVQVDAPQSGLLESPLRTKRALECPAAPVKIKRRRNGKVSRVRSIRAQFFFVDYDNGGEATRLFLLMNEPGCEEVYSALVKEESRAAEIAFKRKDAWKKVSEAPFADEDYHIKLHEACQYEDDEDPDNGLSCFLSCLADWHGGSFQSRLEKDYPKLYARLCANIGSKDNWGEWDIYDADDNDALTRYHRNMHIVCS